MTRQTATDYQDVRELYGIKDERALDDFMGMKNDILDNVPKFGEGSPEGKIIANMSLTYFDKTNSPTSVKMYVNEKLGSSTGWIEVI